MTTPYDICVTPIFVKDGMEYPFEGLVADEQGGKNMEFRFIVNTLRSYFGNDLDIDEKGTQIRILLFSNELVRVLQIINEDTCEFPVKYGRTHLKFVITSYSYNSESLCEGTLSRECNECECD